MGINFSCARRKDGSVSCWGDNSAGQLGDGSADQKRTPLRIPTLSGVTSVRSNGSAWHACAEMDDLSVKCWGDSSAGGAGGRYVDRALGAGPAQDVGQRVGKLLGGGELVGHLLPLPLPILHFVFRGALREHLRGFEVVVFAGDQRSLGP